MLYSIGCKLSDRQPEDYRIRDAIDRQKAEVFKFYQTFQETSVHKFISSSVSEYKYY